MSQVPPVLPVCCIQTHATHCALPCSDELPGKDQMINVLDSAGPAGYVCAACTFPTGTGNTRGKHLIIQSGLLADSGLGWLCGVLSQ